MNNCPRLCSPADVDNDGRCKCDRENDVIPKEKMVHILRKLEDQKSSLEELLVYLIDTHKGFRFIPLYDGLSSLRASIEKFNKVFSSTPKKQITHERFRKVNQANQISYANEKFPT